MSDEERDEMIRIATAFEGFVAQYAKDEERKEIARVEDREDRRKWRDEVTQTVAGLEKKIEPVVRHHEMAVSVTKFALKYGTPSGVLGAIAWLWNHLKDNPAK